LYTLYRMAYKMNRLDPENYSEDILRVVEALRLPSGDDPMFQGSSALKVVYPSDYDLAQYVKVQRDMKRDFQAVIRKLMKLRDAHIGDIKSGEIPELKVIPDNTNSRNYNGRRQGFLTKLKQLVDRKYITSKEYSDSVRLLQPDLTELDMFIIKHDIRFEVVRWTPKDILKGFVVYRKHKVDFNTYLFGNNITKIDIVAWVNGIRYSEITMNYKFVGENGLVVNNKGTDVLNEILSEVPYLFYKGKYLKICKRMFSIETLIANTPQLNREPNKLTQRRLYKLFNGDLNLLNQITGDIGNLIYLVDNVEHIDRDRFEYEVDQMKYRLGVITNLRYLKIEPVVAQMLEQLEANVVSLRVLEKLESFIRGFIEGEVKKQMKKWKLLPIPRVYLPSDRIDLEGGGEDMLGEGMDVKIPKQEFIKEHKKLIPLLKKGSQSERQKEAQDQSEELEKVMSGEGQKRKKADEGRRSEKTHQAKKKYARKTFGALFPKIILIDTRLPHDLEDTQINLGKDEGESITLKKKREQFEGRREFDIYPAGKYDEGLHLEAYVIKKTLHIKNIYTDARPGRGIGTYLFTILFHYLEYQRIKFDKIELVFWPSELNPLRGRIDKKTGRKQPYRHQTPAVILTAMRFYFKVFSTLVNYFPIHQGKEIQITEGTTENLLELIRDYDSASFPSMVFTPLEN